MKNPGTAPGITATLQTTGPANIRPLEQQKRHVTQNVHFDWFRALKETIPRKKQNHAVNKPFIIPVFLMAPTKNRFGGTLMKEQDQFNMNLFLLSATILLRERRGKWTY